jgi:hypothetical protein
MVIVTELMFTRSWRCSRFGGGMDLKRAGKCGNTGFFSHPLISELVKANARIPVYKPELELPLNNDTPVPVVR